MSGGLLLSQAENLGWSNATVSYYQASEAIQPVSESKTQMIIVFILLAIVLILMVIGSAVQFSSLGDKPHFHQDEMKSRQLKMAG